ncbi:MAG: response regulator receiver protein, partial [Ardenticatenales bacterium]|nr:response regulator receiver protein [Ardenticatenales bacterium]
DLPHDFGDVSLQVLDAADVMVLMLAPEMGSVRAASAALTTYGKLGYRDEKIRLVMNWIFERKGLAQSAVEDALRFPISLVLPFAPDTFVSAINLGRPLLLHEPEGQISALIEDFSFGQSRERHRTVPPAAPSPAWQRVNKRLLAFRKAKRK